MRLPALWLFVAAVAAAAACTSLQGLSGGEADAGATGDAGLPPSLPLGPGCGDQLVCAPTPPVGWKYALATQDDAVPCPLGYDPVGTLNVGPDAGPAQCPCTCGPPPPLLCPGTVQVTTASDSACTGTASSYTGGGCDNANNSFGQSVTFLRVASPEGGTSGCSTSTNTIRPPIAYAASWNLCNAQVDPLPGSCPSGQLCLRDPGPGQRVCVRAPPGDAGAPSCPPDYPNLVDGSFQLIDQRGCDGQCTCAASVPCSPGTFEIWKLSNCQGTPQVSVPSDGTCHPIPAANYNTWRYTPGTPTGAPTCTATKTPTPGGGVVPLSGATLCCR
jgi:hypothetical protein